MFLFIFVSERMTSPEPRVGRERKAILERVFGDVGWECPQMLRAMDQVEDIYFDRVSQIRMDGWSKGRTMLIGDAASCVSLMAGEGTGLAMTEAYVLAGELKRAGGDYREAFRSHEQRLAPVYRTQAEIGVAFRFCLRPEDVDGHLATKSSDQAAGSPSGRAFFCGPRYGGPL